MKKQNTSQIYNLNKRYYANDFSILNPTVWANEAILQLVPNMIVSRLIAHDFDNKVAKFGDIVNAVVPATFTMKKKGAVCEDIVTQDASLSSVQVELNQWPYVAFMICDGEEDRNSLDLVNTLLTPAIQALSEGIDRLVGLQLYQFLSHRAGHLGNIDDTNFKQYLLEAREVMNRNNAPLAGRAMIIGPGTETQGLMLDDIMTADKVGDDGSALANAVLGRKYGWLLAMSQSQPEIASGQTTDAAAVNNGSGYPAGATAIGYDGGALAPGQWITIVGDDTPQHITADDGTTLTISPGLLRAVANDAVITAIAAGVVDNAAGYNGTTTSPRVIGYAKEILVDGFDNSPPQIGQGVTFGTQTHVYGITGVTTIDAGAGEFGITLDRPLVSAIANADAVNLLPAGKYNFGFLRDAFVMVNRPLARPRTGTGAVSRVVSDPVNRISLRVTITYDGVKQGHRVVIDTLMGVAPLNDDLGVVMYG